MTLSTPALLFGSISLLLLAYTNRFLVIAQLIRNLYDHDRESPDSSTRKQISNLQQRVTLIKYMQTFGVVSFILCTASMFGIFLEHDLLGRWAFGAAVVALLVSLSLSLWEVVISTRALDYLLQQMEHDHDTPDGHESHK